MTEALSKQPTLAELTAAARVLLEEDPSLTAARYSLRMQEAKDLLDESIRQSNVVQRHTSIIWWLGAV